MRAFTDYMKEIPVPEASPDQQQSCEQLSAALQWLHRREIAEKATDFPVSLMVAYFEQWLNGLVYELFFAGELHANNIHLFEETAKPENTPPDLAKVREGDKLERLHALFQRTYDPNHSICSNLFDLRSIETVRIIEERPGEPQELTAAAPK